MGTKHIIIVLVYVLALTHILMTDSLVILKQAPVIKGLRGTSRCSRLCGNIYVDCTNSLIARKSTSTYYYQIRSKNRCANMRKSCKSICSYLYSKRRWWDKSYPRWDLHQNWQWDSEKKRTSIRKTATHMKGTKLLVDATSK